jgi:membrane protein DedA with SNARE-associated domain/rhodanese-related sulfurtransferase
MDARVPETFTALTGSFGFAAVFVNVLMEQLGLPVPATPLLLVAGAAAAPDIYRAVEVFIVATSTCVLTDVGWFLAGRRYGNRVMRLLCRISLSPDSCVGDTHRRFEHWGGKALVIAKFVPGLTVIAVPLAGAHHMRWPRFLALSALGSTLWIAAPLVLGALAAPQISALLVRLGQFGSRTVMLLAALLTAYILFKWWQRRRLYAQLRMARIEPTELQTLLKRQPAPTVLDVRSRSARALDPRSIPNAVQVPLEEVATRLAALTPEVEVIVYCTCPNEASAARVAKLLIRHGIVCVRPLRGGLDAWIAAGYAVSAIAPSEAAAGG